MSGKTSSHRLCYGDPASIMRPSSVTIANKASPNQRKQSQRRRANSGNDDGGEEEEANNRGEEDSVWWPGWIFVPWDCLLTFPTTGDAWKPLRHKKIILLGDSTTSDTLYHLLRSVLREVSASPPRNRWSDPFEMVVTRSSSKKSEKSGVEEEREDKPEGEMDRFVLFQHRVGSMDDEVGPPVKGLKFFRTERYRERVRTWLHGGMETKAGDETKRKKPAAGDDPKLRVVTVGRKGDFSALPEDLRRRLPDIVMLHSGPHDCRLLTHTLREYYMDVKHMASFLLEESSTAVQSNSVRSDASSSSSTRFLWRSNVVGAGPLYACSRMENPVRYAAMDSAALRALNDSFVEHQQKQSSSSSSRTTIDPFFFLSAKDLTHAFHSGLRHSDGIHYGRYMERYGKVYYVDIMSAVVWWNYFEALLAS